MANYLKLADEPGAPVKAVGDAEAGICRRCRASSRRLISSRFLAHAPMEPIDVTVLFDGDNRHLLDRLAGADAGSERVGASVLGIDPAKVYNQHALGGRFFRQARDLQFPLCRLRRL